MHILSPVCRHFSILSDSEVKLLNEKRRDEKYHEDADVQEDRPIQVDVHVPVVFTAELLGYQGA